MKHKILILSGVLIAAALLCLRLFSPAENPSLPEKDSPNEILDPKYSSSNHGKALTKALIWLMKRQQTDGAWHGDNFSQLQDGAACTSHALASLGAIPPAMLKPYDDNINRAFKFLFSVQDQSGCIGDHAPDAGMPNYATALTLMAVARLKPGLRPADVARACAYLGKSQFAEARNISPEDGRYGAWALGGKGDLADAIHLDLSSTMFCMQAILESGLPPHDPAVKAALVYVRGRQHMGEDVGAYRGGFHFTAAPVDENKWSKAWFDEKLIPGKKIPKPYGTMTGDGLRALLLGEDKGDEARIQSALEWIAENQELKKVSGFTTETNENWDMALRYYYWCSQTSALRLCQFKRGDSPRWINDFLKNIADHLLTLQDAEGFWKNEYPQMLESEAVISTPFAMQTLALYLLDPAQTPPFPQNPMKPIR